MPSLTPGNRLYLYRLLGNALGRGRQAPLAEAEEALRADGIDVTSLGFHDVRQLLEELDDIVRLTVFRRGRLLVTVPPNPSLDEALSRLAERDDKGRRGGAAAWRHRKVAKDMRPEKPRPRRRRAAPAPVEVEPTVTAPDAGPDLTGGAEDARADGEAAQVVASPVPQGDPEGDAGTTRAEVPPAKTHDVAAGPAPVTATSGRAATGVPPTSEGRISLTITYDPHEALDASDGPAGAPATSGAEAPDGAAKGPATRSPDAAGPATPASPTNDLGRLPRDLPESLRDELSCPDEPLSVLYQLLPPDVEPLTVLDEDWRRARGTGTFEATRSCVSFPLRYVGADGLPVRAVIRRVRRPGAQRRWGLSDVAGGTSLHPLRVETVGLEGLAERRAGSWRGLSPEGASFGLDLERELADFMVIGSWDALLQDAARQAAREPWAFGPDASLGAEGGRDATDALPILREYLCATLHDVREQRLLSVADDGSLAAWNTGLLSDDARDVYCVLRPHEGAVPWQLAGCCRAGEGTLGRTLVAQLRALPAPARHARPTGEALTARGEGVSLAPELDQPHVRLELSRTLRRLAQSPTLAAAAFDPAHPRRTVLLLPLGTGAGGGAERALVVTSEGDADGYRAQGIVSPRDAYVCARTVSAELPSWLRELA
ncbi:DUF3825 domain-containing protein [Olsenella sp. HMSC062G07]|uniref:DUF3825 domain-containing protein n=1 Tax=Olsenella sp. HMSC062G07 TaxID=1739330 RepID=UPI0008A39809|nr:DUF3825 domain-containing protein [Olsenella sp. HMSC062G07]OFK22335.1 hypothetical protein HMPREF2826_01835 [Olsenella sp. HMSC062G07]